MQLPVLCELAAFASTWCEQGLKVACRFAQLASTWADEAKLELDMLEADGPAGDFVPKRSALHHRCASASMLVVHCFAAVGDRPVGSGSSFSDANLAQMIEHYVRAQYYQACAHDCQNAPDMKALWQRCGWIMARAAPAFSQHADAGLSAMLSRAATSVFPALPEGLQWLQAAGKAGCWTAQRAADTACYSVNLLTGNALRNAAAPSRLPAAVTNHPMYRTTFGLLNFEVTTDNASRQLVRGRRYRFAQRTDGELCVIESLPAGAAEDELELLPGAHDRSGNSSIVHAATICPQLLQALGGVRNLATLCVCNSVSCHCKACFVIQTLQASKIVVPAAPAVCRRVPLVP